MPKTEEFYEPTKKDFDEAEEMMTNEQKEMTEDRGRQIESKKEQVIRELLTDAGNFDKKKTGLEDAKKREELTLEQKEKIEKRRQEEEKRWAGIESLIKEREEKEKNNLSAAEKLNLIRDEEDKDYDDLNDVERVKATGFFVSESANMDGKYMVMKIENGEMNSDDYDDPFMAYACSDSGHFFEDEGSAKAFAYRTKTEAEDEEEE